MPPAWAPTLAQTGALLSPVRAVAAWPWWRARCIQSAAGVSLFPIRAAAPPWAGPLCVRPSANRTAFCRLAPWGSVSWHIFTNSRKTCSYGRKPQRPWLRRFCRWVFECAGAGDEGAGALLWQTAADIAQLIEALSAKGAPGIALAGGMSEPIRPWLPESVWAPVGCGQTRPITWRPDAGRLEVDP